MLELINSYNNVIDKIKDIFETNDLEIIEYVDYDDGIHFEIGIGNYCILDIYTDKEETRIYTKHINTSLYNEISELRKILENIEKLLLELPKKLTLDKLNYL